jgi:hypothetical protein
MTSKKTPKLQETKPEREGVIRCTSEVRGKQVRSIYVSGVDEFNVVNIDFTDGTALTVQITTIHDLALPITQVQFVTDEQVPELCGTLND